MRLGLDVHGVLDRDTEFFTSMAREVMMRDGYVHIITGASVNEDFMRTLNELFNNQPFWTHVFSIQDYLAQTTDPIGENDQGRPIWRDSDWDRAKGDYCKFYRIDLHFDDTLRYGEYFDTPFIHWEGK